jgi:hypothetical protein
MMLPQYYRFPPQAPHQYLPPQTPPGGQSSPSGPEDSTDLHNYTAWFKLHEPLLEDSIGE